MTKKKTVSVEILQPTKAEQSDANLEKLADLVAQRLSRSQNRLQPEELSVGELAGEVLLQPWFLPREVSNAILRLLPVPHQDKWAHFFADWGCLRCDTKKVIHQSLGLCSKCYALALARLKASILRHSTLDPVNPELIANLTRKVKCAERIISDMGANDENSTVCESQHVERPAEPGHAAPGAARLLPTKGMGDRVGVRGRRRERHKGTSA